MDQLVESWHSHTDLPIRHSDCIKFLWESPRSSVIVFLFHYVIVTLYSIYEIYLSKISPPSDYTRMTLVVGTYIALINVIEYQ